MGGTSDTAGYCPPYNATPEATQKLGYIDLQGLSGVRLPVDTANDFVIDPLRMLLTPPRALPQWSSAAPGQRVKWAAGFTAALSAAAKGDPALAAAGEYGPVPALTGALLVMAAHGNLDGALHNGEQPYNQDCTPTILFLVLQSCLWGVAAGFVVALLCAVLVSSSPERAMDDVAGVEFPVPGDPGDEVPDFGQ